MKFVSLFNRTPDNKKFSYRPRFYDQKAEERKEREDRIRRDLDREKGIETEANESYRSRIEGTFHAARRRSNKGKTELNAVLLRSGLLLFLTMFAIAFLTWGKDALYSLFVFVPLYFYLKFKK